MENIFEEKSLVKMCAPMVRYSRLPFRLLVREYGVDLAFTPMIPAESFIKSETYRKIDYQTCRADQPLIVQLAANNAVDFADVSEMVYGECLGVDLNCGCPQSWAKDDGIGACLMNNPELIADIVKQTRNRIPDTNFSISVKIRIFLDEMKTVDLVRQLEAAGITFLTVHGRTKAERHDPVHYDYIKTVVDSLDIPVIANGDVDSIEKAYSVQEMTGAKGVMAARAIIDNPAMFAGHKKAPKECIRRFIEINEEYDTNFIMFHRHLMHMCAPLFNKLEKREFNSYKTREQILEFLDNKFDFKNKNADL